MSNPFPERQTRSKLALPNIDISLQDSPLKNAKIALKKSRKQHGDHQSSSQPSQSTTPGSSEIQPTSEGGGAVDGADEETDDELLLSPSKRKQPKDAALNGALDQALGSKRPSSPSHDDTYSLQLPGSLPQSPSRRHSKRARRELETLGETSNVKTQQSKRTVRASSEPRLNIASRHRRKRSATPSISNKPASFASTSNGSVLAHSKPRASSVPLFPTSFDPAIPHLDLNNLPPSPQRARSRSPSKEPLPKLRIVSNPFPLPSGLEPIQDEALMDVDSLPASHSEPTLQQQQSGQREGSLSPLTEISSPTTPPPATSSPDLVLPDKTDIISEEITDVSTAVTAIPDDLVPTATVIEPSQTSPVTPLPDEVSPAQAGLPSSSAEETPKPAPPEPKGKSRLPRPTSIVDLASKAKKTDPLPSTLPDKPTSKPRAKSSKGKGTTSGPSKPVVAKNGAPPKRDAFAMLMDTAKLKATTDQSKARGRPSQAVPSSSKIQQARRILFGSEGKPSVPEKPKASMKSKMRPRETPKPLLVPPALLLPPEEDEDLPGSPERTPSPVEEFFVEPPLQVAPSEMTDSPPKENSVTPKLPGLFTPELTPAPSSLFTPPPENVGQAEEMDIAVDPGVDSSPDVVMASPPKEKLEADEPVETTVEPLSSLSDINAALVETEIPAVPGLPPDEPVVHIEPSQEVPAVDSTCDPTPETIVAPSADVGQPAPSPKKRKRAIIPRRSVPNNSPRRVTRSVSQQQKAELENVTTPSLEPVQQELSSVEAPAETIEVVPGLVDRNEDAMVISAPASPTKSAGPRRRSMSLKGGAASKIPVPITPARSRNQASPSKSARSSPSKLARSASLHLPRMSIAGPSSLSTLSDALDRLRMPPPSRPNTSLGFNPDPDDDNDEVGKGKSIDDITLNRPLQRASTLDLISKGGSVKGKGKATTLVQKPMTTFFAPQAGGKPGDRLLKTGVRSGPRIFGFARGRVAPRASKKTSLPSVMHSPVKGGGDDADDANAGEDIEVSDVTTRTEGRNSDVFAGPSLVVPREDVDDDMAVIMSSKGKEPKKDDGRKNATRRASMALQGLSQSLSSLPRSSEAGLMGPPATPKDPAKTSGSSDPSPRTEGPSEESTTLPPPDVTPPPGRVTRSSAAKSAPGALGKVKGGSGGHVSSTRKEAESETPPAVSDALSVLDDCVVFLDVKTDEGEDAGDLFLEMLQRLGARILSRVGQTCTHIVYKNGLSSTVSRWRKMKNKPAVVGIAWVVECAEQRQRVDETPHLIDLEGVNVAGVVKRRRSMLPRFIARELEDETPHQDGQDDQNTANASSGSITLEEDLPPLEIIRRRTLGVAS